MSIETQLTTVNHVFGDDYSVLSEKNKQTKKNIQTGSSNQHYSRAAHCNICGSHCLGSVATIFFGLFQRKKESPPQKNPPVLHPPGLA